MNVINDNWLFVEYIDGTKTQVSIRQAFIDAIEIKNIITPIFHNTEVYIYNIPVIQLLVTILEAAYFKPKNNFMARSKYFSKKLLKDGWDINLILDYLDTWQNRFNLFDDTYPFMQDIVLKDADSKTDDLSYISRTSVIAPGGNNLVFEHNLNKPVRNYLNQYQISEDELVYLLLYNRVMGTSPMAKQYPNKSLCTNATLFILNYGKNLFETIVYNCLPLRDSVYEEDLFDRPVWELNSYSEIKDYEIENLYKNVLLCTFFPSLPIYVKYDDKINDIILSKNSDDCILNKETRNMLASVYCRYNPWAIRTSIKEDDKEIEKYKEWTKNLKLINLCIDATKKLPSGFACNTISPELQENRGAKCVVYYRQYDGMKANVLSYGKYEVNQDIFTALQDESNHEKAVEFQTIIKKISDKHNEFRDSGIPKYIIDNYKLDFSRYAEQYFFNNFVPNIEDSDIIEKSIQNLTNYAKKQVRKLDSITNNPLKYAQAYKFFSGSLNKLKKEGNL